MSLTACTTTRAPSQSWPSDDGSIEYPPWPGPEAPPQEVPPVPPRPEPVPPPSYPQSAAEVSGPAVLALIGQAQDQRNAGNGEVAAATLDRARRIEPRNPFVWVEMVKTQLALQQPQDAEATAERARAYARGNPHIDRQLWQLIAEAREQQGDGSGASTARARADDIARGMVR